MKKLILMLIVFSIVFESFAIKARAYSDGIGAFHINPDWPPTQKLFYKEALIKKLNSAYVAPLTARFSNINAEFLKNAGVGIKVNISYLTLIRDINDFLLRISPTHHQNDKVTFKGKVFYIPLPHYYQQSLYTVLNSIYLLTSERKIIFHKSKHKYTRQGKYYYINLNKVYNRYDLYRFIASIMKSLESRHTKSFDRFFRDIVLKREKDACRVFFAKMHINTEKDKFTNYQNVIGIALSYNGRIVYSPLWQYEDELDQLLTRCLQYNRPYEYGTLLKPASYYIH